MRTMGFDGFLLARMNGATSRKPETSSPIAPKNIKDIKPRMPYHFIISIDHIPYNNTTREKEKKTELKEYTKIAPI